MEIRTTPARPALAELIEARLSRRSAIKGMGAALAGIVAADSSDAPAAESKLVYPTPFEEVPHGYDADMHIPPNYTAQVLMRWGDAVTADAPKFDPRHQTPEAQAKQFGYNNDFLAFLPLPIGSDTSERGLLCANHEYTIAELMFPAGSERDMKRQVDVQMAAHGHGVVEIARAGDGWKPITKSKYNRRLTALATEMRLAGPAAGSERLKTTADPTGTRVIGTINNCAGGVTPWRTVLSGEENFHAYFLLRKDADVGPEKLNHKRYGLSSKPEYLWHTQYSRFNAGEERNEPNRFGWVIEFDPYDPQSIPVKRTALGRMKHEGATPVVSSDARVVVYLGDDQKNEYLYRFVSKDAYEPKDRKANFELLDAGTLYVARFNEDGTMRWISLEHGQGPLTAENGFASQADVLIETRRAADLVGATTMDRPEDIDADATTGRVYVMLTNNADRTETNPANPRPANRHGHIIELIPPGAGESYDHTAAEFRWEVLLLAGRPNTSDDAQYHPEVSEDGWLSCPDNCTFDPQGNLWISTDGAPSAAKVADGLYLCYTRGPTRALTRHFFRAPRGAEVTGPCFTPDGTTLFLAVQHPGDDPGSTFHNPSTRWPDFQPDMPPRPSVVAIRRKDGGPVGG